MPDGAGHNPRPARKDRSPRLDIKAGYDHRMVETLEDDRGVDRADLRERIRLLPSERVERLVREVRVWSEIQAAAANARA